MNDEIMFFHFMSVWMDSSDKYTFGNNNHRTFNRRNFFLKTLLMQLSDELLITAIAKRITYIDRDRWSRLPEVAADKQCVARILFAKQGLFRPCSRGLG